MTENEFKSLVTSSKDRLYRVSLALLGNRQEAEDALQEIYLKLWTMRNQLTGYKSVEALAVTMTKNHCIDRLRSYWHRNKNSDEVELIPVPDTGPDPEESAELSESRSFLLMVFQTLPEQQRLIIHLRDIEHYSYEEIREITGMAVNSIRVSLSRARKAVRQEYLKRQNYGLEKN